MTNEYVDVAKVIVRPISKTVAKNFIVKHHYSHRFSSCRYAFGIYYIESDHLFFEGENEKLIGALTYGHPVGFRVVNSIVNDIEFDMDAVLELTRLVILDGYGKNIESYSISQSIRWIEKNDKKVKVLVSYADSEWDHVGTVYQATNWIYQGFGVSKLMDDFSIKEHPDGPWIHSRTVGAKWGPKKLETLAQTIGHTFWRKEELPKYRYIYFLGSKKEKKRYMENLKYPSVPYPKKEDIRPPRVERVEVNNGKVSVFEETYKGDR